MIVMGNAIKLEQVFINLLTNARDALASATRKVVTISCEVKEEVVELQVGDTGPGIPPGFEKRIFDPFFTTKEGGAGTGLGLSITYSIIKHHQGTITAHNRPADGALVGIHFPLINHERN